MSKLKVLDIILSNIIIVGKIKIKKWDLLGNRNMEWIGVERKKFL